MEYETEYGLARVIEREIDLCRTVERHREQLFQIYRFNLIEAFDYVSNRSAYISKEQLKDFLREQGHTYITEDDMTSIYRRYDSDGDDYLSYVDFVASLVPQKHEKKFVQAKSMGREVRFESAYMAGNTPQTKAFTEAQSTQSRALDRSPLNFSPLRSKYT